MPREALATAQTPQGFPFAPLLAAHRSAAEAGRDDLTDDAAVAALAGLTVRAVDGDRGNMKLTNPADFAAAEGMLAMAMETRTGQGFDVHAFGPGHSVWLCGVEIPHDRGPGRAFRRRCRAARADRRAARHDRRRRHRRALSALRPAMEGRLLRPLPCRCRAARRRERGGRIVNLDVTLVCEAPKIAPHRDAMRARIAEIAGIDAGRVGVKATTSEKMGFTGRGEGIVAFAIATVALPAERMSADFDALVGEAEALLAACRAEGPEARDGRVLHRRPDRRDPDRGRRLVGRLRARLRHLFQRGEDGAARRSGRR